MRNWRSGIVFFYVCTILSVLFSFPEPALSGGAVASQRKKAATQKKVIQEQFMVREQVAASTAHGLAQEGMAIETTVDVPILDKNINIYWEHLKKSSEPWLHIKNEETKVTIISKYINLYKEQNIDIFKAPERYCKLIDKMLEGKPALLSVPLLEVLMIVAVFEYDFNNGQDKDMMVDKIFEKYGQLE